MIKYKRHFPKHKGFGDATQLNTEDILDFDLLVGGFPCFTSDTLIQTDRGVLPIVNVRKGDKVLTHKNRYMPVLNKMVKYYDDVGYKIHFPFVGKYNIVKCTKNHPFFVYNDGNPIWKAAEDLTEEDYCFVPLNNNECDVINFHYTKGVNGYVSEMWNIVLDDEDWWWCLGYYIGDGWYEKRRKIKGKWVRSTRITLATNPKECDFVAERFSKFFKCNIHRNKLKISFYDSCFYNFVRGLGDNALGKHLPYNFDKYPLNILSALIDGYVYADGCVIDDKRIKTSTISEELAFQTFIAFLKLYNTLPIFSFVKTPDTTVIEGREVNSKDYYQVIINLKKTKEPMVVRDNDGGLWIKIKNIEKYNLNDFVYNLEVELDNSYAANGIAVHS